MSGIIPNTNEKLIKSVKAKESHNRVIAYRKLMEELSSISTGGGKFSREEMNERR